MAQWLKLIPHEITVSIDIGFIYWLRDTQIQKLPPPGIEPGPSA